MPARTRRRHLDLRRAGAGRNPYGTMAAGSAGLDAYAGPAGPCLRNVAVHTSSIDQHPQGGPHGAGFIGLAFLHRRSRPAHPPAARAPCSTLPSRRFGLRAPCGAPIPAGRRPLPAAFASLPSNGLIHAHSSRRPAVKHDIAPRPAPGRLAWARSRGGDPP